MSERDDTDSGTMSLCLVIVECIIAMSICPFSSGSSSTGILFVLSDQIYVSCPLFRDVADFEPVKKSL